MTFYLEPPSGSVSYQKLEEFGLNRFRFLARLVACKDGDERSEAILDAKTVNWSECLIVGSVKDKISHYILRLTLAGDADSDQFFIEAERVFFRMRLDSFSTQEWLSFFKNLRKQLSQYPSDHLNDLRAFLSAFGHESISWLSLVEGIKYIDDKSKFIHLPFQLVPNLVSERRVVLNQGYALVPLYMIPEVLEELFKGLMVGMVHRTSQQLRMYQDDTRMSRLQAIMRRAYQKEVNPSSIIPVGSKALTLDKMTSSRVFFPPCMSHLMTTLETHHRLCHQDRIQLTLFLKELGLPVYQALLFWKREYSKPSVARFNGMSCGHNWQGNERRYIYNIRHLYGLEGKRISYAAHSCASIQGRQLSCIDSGGCPFTSLEPATLTTRLSKEGLARSEIEDILQSVKDGRVERACGIAICRRITREVVSNNHCGKCDNHSNITEVDKRNASCSSCVHKRQGSQRSRSFESNLQQRCKCLVACQMCCDINVSRYHCQSSGNFETDGIYVSPDKKDVGLETDTNYNEEINKYCGVSKNDSYTSQKRCFDDTGCDGCRKKRKLLHSYKEVEKSRCTNYVYNRDKVCCVRDKEDVNETKKKGRNSQSCCGRTELNGSQNLITCEKNSHYNLLHSSAFEDIENCYCRESKTKDFKCAHPHSTESKTKDFKCAHSHGSESKTKDFKRAHLYCSESKTKDFKCAHPYCSESKTKDFKCAHLYCSESKNKDFKFACPRESNNFLDTTENCSYFKYEKKLCGHHSTMIRKIEQMPDHKRDLLSEKSDIDNGSTSSCANKTDVVRLQRRKPSSIYWDAKSFAAGWQIN